MNAKANLTDNTLYPKSIISYNFTHFKFDSYIRKYIKTFINAYLS